MARCFETEAGVAACDDDGLAGILLGGVGGGKEELGAQEGNGGLHAGHLGGLIGISFSWFDFNLCQRGRSGDELRALEFGF